MKPPWLAHTQDSAELEALQTDVMRFVAILGMCLAAIFSLVHSAALEQRASAENQPVPAPPPAAEAPPTAAVPEPQLAAEMGRPATPPTVEKTARRGFTLEFSSAAALDSLLRSGVVTLYLRLDNSFLRLGPQGHFQASDAPDNYYVMTASTVPGKYVAAVSAGGASKGGTWGVTLPASISGQITRHMQSTGNGSLVIDGSGSVSLHGVTAP